jgi:hypothetical protein
LAELRLSDSRILGKVKKGKMEIKEEYINLKDLIIYNIHYACHYPEEDKTSLDKEFNKMVAALNVVVINTKDPKKLELLNQASEKIKISQPIYAEGKDGRELLEEALSLVEKAEKNEKNSNKNKIYL